MGFNSAFEGLTYYFVCELNSFSVTTLPKEPIDTYFFLIVNHSNFCHMTPKHRMFVFKLREMLDCGEIGKRVSELFINHYKNVKNEYWSDVRCPQVRAT